MQNMPSFLIKYKTAKQNNNNKKCDWSLEQSNAIVQIEIMCLLTKKIVLGEMVGAYD